MVRPGEMLYSVVDLTVRIAGTFSAKLPYRPVGAMFVVQEFDKGVSWVAVSALWIGGGGARCGDYWLGIRSWTLLLQGGRTGGSDVFTVVCDVAEVQACLGMA